MKFTKGQIVEAARLAFHVGAGTSYEFKNYGVLGAVAMVIVRGDGRMAYRLDPEGGSELLEVEPI